MARTIKCECECAVLCNLAATVEATLFGLRDDNLADSIAMCINWPTRPQGRSGG